MLKELVLLVHHASPLADLMAASFALLSLVEFRLGLE